MSWLLGLADALARGGTAFVIFDVALVWGAVLAFFLAGRGGSWLTVALAAALAFLPQLIVYPAIVWKDVLLAGAATAGFAALAWAAHKWERPAWRYGLGAAGLLLISLAALTRQNGALVLPFAAAAAGWLAMRDDAGANWRSGLAYGLGFLGAGAAIVLAASAALQPRIDSRQPLAAQWEHLQLYDLTAAVVRQPDLPLPVLHARAPWLEALVRGPAADAYTPSRIDPLTDALLEPMRAHAGDASAVVADQWRDLISRHPWLYLRVRASAFRWVATAPDPTQCLPVWTGVDGENDEALAAAGLKGRETGRDEAIRTYAEALATTPLLSHATYAALALALLALFLRRRRPADIAAAAMLASALAFAASFALISIACDYRYLYDLDVAALAAALYAAASWRARSAA